MENDLAKKRGEWWLSRRENRWAQRRKTSERVSQGNVRPLARF